jgi:hypothetical protein
MKKSLIIVPIVLILLASIPIIFRVWKDIKKKLQYANTYAIVNVYAGKAIRVHNANYQDNAKTILYTHHNWECITWEMIQLQDSTYLLKNLYTQKTFEPVSSPTQGASLWQKPLGDSKYQYWEFLKQTDETYLIRLKGADLYVTISSDKDNSGIILIPQDNSDKQKWRLIRQTPWI